MPELPEVEVIRRELQQKLTGETIDRMEVFWERTLVNTDQIQPAGQTIRAIGRHGKYMIFQLSDDFMVIHLRMTGQVIVRDYRDQSTHLRVLFRLKSGQWMHYYDSRKFGRIYLVRDPKPVLRNVGVDAMSEIFTVEILRGVLAKSRVRIKSVLLNQAKIAGLGNIYVDESLFRAGIHPETSAMQVPASQCEKLYREIRTVLSNAIDGMGTTISDYRTSGGGFGSYQGQLNVYGRDGQACAVCRTKIEKIRVSNRGTHFCPKCQPEPVVTV
jgi:formamidopyrimidine-DNA glycosylase